MAKGTEAEPLPPVRGLVATHNANGKPFALTSLKKWLHLTRLAHKVEKVDLRVVGQELACLSPMLEFAANEDIHLSLRTEAPVEKAALEIYQREGLYDVFYCPPSVSSPGWASFLDACAELRLPLRLLVRPPFPEVFDAAIFAEKLAAQGVAHVDVAFRDPFLPPWRAPSESQASATLQQMCEIVAALRAREIPVSLLHVPFCHVEEALWPHVINGPQRALCATCYAYPALHLAHTLHQASPRAMTATVEQLLSRPASFVHIFDRNLFPWILDHPWLHVRAWLLYRLVRPFERLWQKPRPLPEEVEAFEAELARIRKDEEKQRGPECSRCRLQDLCDHGKGSYGEVFSGWTPKAIPGDPVADALLFGRERLQYFDSIDEARREEPECRKEMAAAARRRMNESPPSRVIAPEDYTIEDHRTDYMSGAVRWWSLTNSAYRSTPLAKVTPPFALSVNFLGGIAKQAGFTFGRYAHLVCPMIDTSHEVALYVNETGHYVLLRDGVPVRPTEFENGLYVPRKLGNALEPRIGVWNIDGMLMTQNVRLWEGEAALPTPEAIAYSVIIVSTRFSRRLQAVLLSLAHQREFDPAHLEVLVAYVPGIDGTDDLLDSLSAAHPGLRIVRAPFAEELATNKGFLINETVPLADGEHIVLLDSDILLPPDFFSGLARLDGDPPFVAPEGRKMLGPGTTAQILLGEVRPWEEYGVLLDSEGELRHREAHGIPIGFCQVVKREVIEAIRYREASHFEGSDWIFGDQATKRFGPETRLDGVDVLHLDHGGSQWSGTPKHL